MLVHIGNDVIIRSREVVAILDVRAAALSPITRDFVAYARSQGRLRDLASGNEKAYVVTPASVFISPVSVTTLRRRAMFQDDEELHH